MLGHLRALSLDNFKLDLLPRSDLRSFFRALPRIRYLHTSDWYPDRILQGLLDAGENALPDLRVLGFFQALSEREDCGFVSPPLLLRFLAAFPLARYCLTISGHGDERPLHTFLARLEPWPRICTAKRHAAPDADGRCGHCVPIRRVPLEDASVSAAFADAVTVAAAAAVEPHSDWVELTDASGLTSYFNSRTQQTAWRNPDAPLAEEAEPEPMSIAESLSLIQTDYAAALVASGPWVPL